MDKPVVSSFTVVRRDWYRGYGSSGSRLERKSDGRMCCLGFYAKACGISSEGLAGTGFPSDIPSWSEPLKDNLEWLWADLDPNADLAVSNSLPEQIIGKINDDYRPDITPELREELLTAEFAKHGVTVTFVD